MADKAFLTAGCCRRKRFLVYSAALQGYTTFNLKKRGEKMQREAEILRCLECMREKMVSAAMHYGFNHPIVLQYSQKIDDHHNQLLKSSSSL